MENTFFIIKPDGVRRLLVGSVINRIEHRGFTIERLEMRQVTKEVLDQHYADLVDRPFYPDIVSYNDIRTCGDRRIKGVGCD